MSMSSCSWVYLVIWKCLIDAIYSRIFIRYSPRNCSLKLFALRTCVKRGVLKIDDRLGENYLNEIWPNESTCRWFHVLCITICWTYNRWGFQRYWTVCDNSSDSLVINKYIFLNKTNNSSENRWWLLVGGGETVDADL